MTEKDIQKISEQYKDEKEPLYEHIHERVEGMIVQQANKRKKLNAFYKVFPVSLAMVLIICLVIILPIVLQPTGEQPDSEIRYSDFELDIERLESTLKEYAISQNENYLYINLYDIAEDLTASRYFKIGEENLTVYLQESFTHGETGYYIQQTIMKRNVIVEEYEQLFLNPQEMAIKDVTITYEITRQYAKVQFEYLDYKYCLDFGNIDEYFDVEFLTEIITNMFETQQATA